jgi:hypothetical protein
MSIMDDIRAKVADRISRFLLPDLMIDAAWRNRLETYELQQSYYRGAHRRQMQIKPGQADDNIMPNFVRLVVERSVSMMLGEGVEFDIETDAPAEYIDQVWKANNKDILLHKAGQNAAIYGTGYIKIVPGGAESRESEDMMLPRLVVLDPRLVTIETNPDDVETVEAYVVRWVVSLPNGDEARMERTERVYSELERGVFETTGWVIKNYVSNRSTGGKWVQTDETAWDYEFPPIKEWQNLPLANEVYGASEVDDIIDLQDRYNFVTSNINRIIRYHAHPKTWGRMATTPERQSWGADEMVLFMSPDAHLENLEMQSDLASSQAFALSLRQAIFDVSRTVDISSMNDKLGALTNFGLRVLYYDALQKLNSKRELLGEALTEINHRLLVLAGIEPSDGGVVVWQEPLPVDEAEQVRGVETALRMGVLSKETAAGLLDYDWEQEQERISGEREAEQANSDNVGEMLLRNFNNGRGEFGARE